MKFVSLRYFKTFYSSRPATQELKKNDRLLTLCISLIFVTCLPNSHKSTPNFKAQFFTLQYDKDNVKWTGICSETRFVYFDLDSVNIRIVKVR